MTERVNDIIKDFNIENTETISAAFKSIEELTNLSTEEKINLSEALTSIFYYHDFNEDPEIEKIASKSCQIIGSFGSDVLPFLLEELINADAESAVYLGRCIAFSGAKGVECILETWDQYIEDDFAIINIIQALSGFKMAEIETAVPKLIHATRSNNPHVKSMALTTIGTISLNNSIAGIDEKVRKSMFNAVFSLLSDRKPLVRKNAVSTLGKMHKKAILTREQEGKVHAAFMSMLGKDGKHNWDREFIVRHEIEHFIQLFTAKETLADRYRQSFRILNKKELCHNTFHYEIEAPLIANKIKAGQFIIVRHNETSERIPLSVCGWDRKKGSIQIIVNSVGKTSTEINMLNPGNNFTDIVGPLGVRSRITKYNGTCVVIGGGYGAGAIIPTAKDLKDIGNRVVGVIGARTKNLLLMVDELKKACDEVIITTNDGSEGMTGFVTTALEEILNREKVEHVLAVGPVPMMEAISNMTRPKAIETYVSLNAIMVDGTGMCGACRVSIGKEVKFACIDGPDFNGHLVDFNELIKRQKMFVKSEQEAFDALAI